MNNPGVLSNKSFRRLWIALSLSSLGDWLSILALTALARSITEGYAAQSYAIGGVLIVKLLPAVLLGPLAGAVADHFDRRTTMVVADVLRFALFLSIPIVGRLDWLFIATFLVECVTLFWMPAKEATVPNLVAPAQLERANQLSLLSTYGSAPVAAALFSLLAVVSNVLMPGPDLALYFNAVTFLVSAATIFSLREIPGVERRKITVPSLVGTIVDGWKFAGTTPLVRGLVVGMVGAFAAGGVVIGISRVYVEALGGGDAGYGMVFGSVFVGLAFGMFLGPRMLRDLSRRRLFGLAIVFAAGTLALVALIQNMVAVVVLVALLGAGAGVAWVTGYTLIGLEVRDELRGRTFAFVASLVRVVLLLVLAVAPLAAGALGPHELGVGAVHYRFDGTNGVLLIGAVIALLAGIGAYRQMDDRRGVPLSRDLYGALRGVPYVPPAPKKDRGLFIAFEGGDGAGKTTQSRLLAIWLRDQGFDVVTTREPGATKVGMRLRAILLDRETTSLSYRAESLLYAADRAQHVDTVVRPALDRGAVVITDRYIDSTLAYQGHGRELPVTEIAEINAWATGALVPDLTILLDVPPSLGLNRFATPADRIESEPAEYHDRVRRGFRALADAEPHRYLVVDASQEQQVITRLIQDRVRRILPDPVPASTEDITSTFPAITDA
ncbi:dTMP kinase [Actinocorallia lasiicapitis]